MYRPGDQPWTHEHTDNHRTLCDLSSGKAPAELSSPSCVKSPLCGMQVRRCVFPCPTCSGSSWSGVFFQCLCAHIVFRSKLSICTSQMVLVPAFTMTCRILLSLCLRFKWSQTLLCGMESPEKTRPEANVPHHVKNLAQCRGARSRQSAKRT